MSFIECDTHASEILNRYLISVSLTFKKKILHRNLLENKLPNIKVKTMKMQF